MSGKAAVPVTFRLTAQEKAAFRIWCLRQGLTMQDVLAEFVRGKLRKGQRS